MRRRLGLLGLIAGLITTLSQPAAFAQDYPARPVKIICGFAAGGTVDALARIYADKLSQHFGKQFVVENVPGNGGHIASAMAARSAPDGYTLFIATNANTTGVSLYEKLNYEFPADFTAIAMLASAPSVLVASPMAGFNSVKELIAFAKAKPGEVLYGSAGVGTATHMAAELFQIETGTKLTHVPYKALSAATVDLLAGRISILFSPLGTVAGQIKAGQVKALAITGDERSSLAPEIPSTGDAGLSGFDVKLWVGLIAPKNTPKDIIQAVGKAVEAAQKDEEMLKRVVAVGGEPSTMTFGTFAAYMEKDIKVWAKVVDHTGIKIK
jgi:tripartite-type tricarboxylate transporter receptor subunit TctC